MSGTNNIEDALSSYIIGRDTVKPNRPRFHIDAGNLKSAIALLKQCLGDEALYLSNIIGVDKVAEGVIELNYFIHVVPLGNTIVIRVTVPRDKPQVSSLIDVIPGALSGECEAYDLLGVEFIGNRYLRRGFFVPVDVASRGVFPLRKDAKV
ncbi:MAG: NADH-quinone oxidoreductase subunit C [Ignisphaera sp.]|nr:NADH-quinone oxidoreductase subunit C [Ignisphaera sp.]MCX8167882.1 NADH-quinone oxidoreductase subunit C [Ignisphaera sp.]MDW8085477.1 NADH-quinone oxidoreductase subunit C [Ignisphaera sp.]